jgi:hypothetical protein
VLAVAYLVPRHTDPGEDTLLRFATYERLLGTVLILTVFLVCGLTPMQADSWWQLRAGQDMWVSQRVLLTDVYSHTAYGTFWPNHEWLAELIFYCMYRLGGLPLLTLFAAALIAGGWALTWHLTRGPARVAFACTAFALLSAAGWWEPRPHAFSLLLLMTTVFLLVRRANWWLPLVFLVWANCHGGVLLGFVILATGLAVQTLMAPRTWWRAALVMSGCALAATATPLGLSFWTEIPKSLLRINLYPLDEWKRPRLSDITLVPFWIIGIAFCAGLVRQRHRLLTATPRDATLRACALVLLPMALMAVRNVGPFLMVAVPALLSLFPVPPGAAGGGARSRPVANLVFMSFGVLAVATTLFWAYRNEIPRLKWTPVPPAALVALRRCPDNLYNRYDEGGYLIWFAPDRKVFLDGRQDPFSPDLVLEHVQMETRGGAYESVFARHGIHCAYLPNVSPTAAQLSAAGWKVLYRDSKWVVLRD